MNVKLDIHAAEQTARPDPTPERELARNRETLAILRTLRIPKTAELEISFVFETAGPETDRALAAQIERETGYRVTVEPEGVRGVTTPIEMSAGALDQWVGRMVRTGAMNGAPFSGWTVAVSRV